MGIVYSHNQPQPMGQESIYSFENSDRTTKVTMRSSAIFCEVETYKASQRNYESWSITKYGAEVDTTHYVVSQEQDPNTKLTRISIEQSKTHTERPYSVRYLDEAERKTFEVGTNKDGQLTYVHGGTIQIPIVTYERKSGQTKQIHHEVAEISFSPGEVIDFSLENIRAKLREKEYPEQVINQLNKNIPVLGIMSDEGKLYIAPKIKRIIHHSSMLAGGPVSAAFMSGTVMDGRLTSAVRFSGHYCPNDGAVKMYDALAKNLSNMGYQPDENSEGWEEFVKPTSQFVFAMSELRANGNIITDFVEVRVGNTYRKVRVDRLKLGDVQPLVRVDNYFRR